MSEEPATRPTPIMSFSTPARELLAALGVPLDGQRVRKVELVFEAGAALSCTVHRFTTDAEAGDATLVAERYELGALDRQVGETA